MARKSLQTQKKELEDGKARLADAKKELEDGRSQLASAKSSLPVAEHRSHLQRNS